MNSPQLAMLILAGAAAGGEPKVGAPLAHADEIKMFASTLSIAKTVSDRCQDILVNMTYLDDLRSRLNMTDEDKPVFAAESRKVVGKLSEGLSEASSPQAWCDAVYRLYGPDGTMIRGLLKR